MHSLEFATSYMHWHENHLLVITIIICHALLNYIHDASHLTPLCMLFFLVTIYLPGLLLFHAHVGLFLVSFSFTFQPCLSGLRYAGWSGSQTIEHIGKIL